MGVGIVNSVIAPAGVILPIFDRHCPLTVVQPISVNHKFPSGPATMLCGCEFSVEIEYSLTGVVSSTFCACDWNDPPVKSATRIANLPIPRFGHVLTITRERSLILPFGEVTCSRYILRSSQAG